MVIETFKCYAITKVRRWTLLIMIFNEISLQGNKLYLVLQKSVLYYVLGKDIIIINFGAWHTVFSSCSWQVIQKETIILLGGLTQAMYHL